MQNSAPMLLTLDEIFEEFADLERQDQSLYLLELGDNLPELPDEARTEENRVHGCQSQVWLDWTEREGRIFFDVDSDALIVRGLIAIMLAAFDGRTPRAILDFDIEGYFERLDLLKHLSPTRGNGLRAMVQRVRDIAAGLAKR